MKQLINLEPPFLIKKEEIEIIDQVGNGAFAKVYKVVYKQQIYALKSIQKQILIKNYKVEQSKLELEIMYSLDHPNIIKLWTHYEDDDYVHLLMEFIKGSDLYQILQDQSRFTEAQTIYYFKQVLSAITYLHSRPKAILHRDIKPENILCQGSTIKLADFGSANSISQDKRTTFTGTQLYMAPEILEGESYDQSVDIWSLGVLIYELLQGRSPFLQSDQSIQKDILLSNIKHVNLFFPLEFPPLARDLVRKMLQKIPNERISLDKIAHHPWLCQELPFRVPNISYVKRADKIQAILDRLNERRQSEEYKSELETFNQKIQSFTELKTTINEHQVRIFKNSIENAQLKQKLAEIEEANQREEEQALISPLQIVKIEEKFRKLSDNVKHLQQQIIDNENYLLSNGYKVSKLKDLQSKIVKEKNNIENMEKQLMELGNQKKIEQQKQDEVFQQFSALNNQKNLETQVAEENDNYLPLLRNVIEKMSQVIHQHKDQIDNVIIDETMEVEDNCDEDLDDQLDEHLEQLQTQFDQKKREYQKILQEEYHQLHLLEEENQKLKVKCRNHASKEACIKKAEQIHKNIDFSYKIKMDKISDLQSQFDNNHKKLKDLEAIYDDSKHRHKLP